MFKKSGSLRPVPRQKKLQRPKELMELSSAAVEKCTHSNKKKVSEQIEQRT
jgi:hypothetical protein